MSMKELTRKYIILLWSLIHLQNHTGEVGG